MVDFDLISRGRPSAFDAFAEVIGGDGWILSQNHERPEPEPPIDPIEELVRFIGETGEPDWIRPLRTTVERRARSMMPPARSN